MLMEVRRIKLLGSYSIAEAQDCRRLKAGLTIS